MSQAARATLSDSQIRDTFRAYHAARANLAKASPEDKAKVEKIVEEQTAKGVPAERVQAGFKYLKRVLEECTEDEWHAFVAAGEPPPVKLSAYEMEALRGGEICVIPGALAYAVITLECAIIAAIALN